MKPFLGLFAHWDVIARQEAPQFLGKFFRDRRDSEYHISEKLHQQISSTLKSPARIIGGNAANAAVTLSDIGMRSVLSCPLRSKNLMSELSKHKISIICNEKERNPKDCSRPDADPEHIIFEMKGYRKIFYRNIMHMNFLLDSDFWNSLNDANYLFLSGFHCVPEKHRKKVGEIADLLEKRKFKVHMELGFGKNSLMKYAVKSLLDRNCIDSLGMNETELGTLGISGSSPLALKEKLLSSLEKTSMERMSLHTREYRLSVFRKNPERNLKAAELSIQACAAKALGGIKQNMEKAKSAPRSAVKAEKGNDFFIIPTRIVENPKIIVGLGDAASVTDSYFAMKASS
jgi:ADP-dependent phosphofructokinase/glucokinase